VGTILWLAILTFRSKLGWVTNIDIGQQTRNCFLGFLVNTPTHNSNASSNIPTFRTLAGQCFAVRVSVLVLCIECGLHLSKSRRAKTTYNTRVAKKSTSQLNIKPSTSDYRDRVLRAILRRLDVDVAYPPDQVHAASLLEDNPEGSVPAVRPARVVLSLHEETGVYLAVRVAHGAHQPLSAVLDVEVVRGERGPVLERAQSAPPGVRAPDRAPLDGVPRQGPVEPGARVAPPACVVAGAKRREVLGRPGHGLPEQAYDQPLRLLVLRELDVQVHLARYPRRGDARVDRRRLGVDDIGRAVRRDGPSPERGRHDPGGRHESLQEPPPALGVAVVGLGGGVPPIVEYGHADITQLCRWCGDLDFCPRRDVKRAPAEEHAYEQ
ncbi:hypothetical protein THAOC_10776, partial [Thalassiosira oceanica]